MTEAFIFDAIRSPRGRGRAEGKDGVPEGGDAEEELEGAVDIAGRTHIHEGH